MEVVACRGCRKLFNSKYGEEFCSECRSVSEEDYRKVREYLWDHPNTPAEQVSRDCNVPLAEVMHYVRQERLTIADDSRVLLSCERCGKKILHGTYCKDCEKKLYTRYEQESLKKKQENKSISGKYSEGKKKAEDLKMRYL